LYGKKTNDDEEGGIPIRNMEIQENMTMGSWLRDKMREHERGGRSPPSLHGKTKEMTRREIPSLLHGKRQNTMRREAFLAA